MRKKSGVDPHASLRVFGARSLRHTVDELTGKSASLMTAEHGKVAELADSAGRLYELLLLFTPLFPPDPVEKAGRKVQRVLALLQNSSPFDTSLSLVEGLPEKSQEVIRLARLLKSRRDHDLEKVMQMLSPAELKSLRLALVRFPFTTLRACLHPDPFVSTEEYAFRSVSPTAAEVADLMQQRLEAPPRKIPEGLKDALRRHRHRLEIFADYLPSSLTRACIIAGRYERLLTEWSDLASLRQVLSLRVRSARVGDPVSSFLDARIEALYKALTAMEGDPFLREMLIQEERALEQIFHA